ADRDTNEEERRRREAEGRYLSREGDARRDDFRGGDPYAHGGPGYENVPWRGLDPNDERAFNRRFPSAGMGSYFPPARADMGHAYPATPGGYPRSRYDYLGNDSGGDYHEPRYGPAYHSQGRSG